MLRHRSLSLLLKPGVTEQDMIYVGSVLTGENQEHSDLCPEEKGLKSRQDSM